MTNYRKNSEPFYNLLTMSPIFDSNDNYRFVVAVQFEVDATHKIKRSLARRKLVRLGRFLHQLPVKLPYPSMQESTKLMLRGPIVAVTASSAGEYLERRASTMGANYDGSGVALERHTNIWMTRCNWLVRSAGIINALLGSAAAGDEGVSSLIDGFLKSSCPNLVPKIVAFTAVIDIVLDAKEQLTTADIAGINDDVLGMLMILLRTVRAVATEQRMRRRSPQVASSHAASAARKGR